MAVPNIATPTLPRSHYFITISRGASMRTRALHVLSVHGLIALVVLMGLWSLGSTLYLLFHDDIVSAMMARQTRMQYAYEDRLSALRGEIDRQESRHLADSAKLDGKMTELFSREAQLESRAALVAGLASRAGILRDRGQGLEPAGSSRAGTRPDLMTNAGRLPALPADVLGYDAPPPRSLPAITKPHPEAEPLFDQESAPGKPPGRASIDPDGLAPQAGLPPQVGLSPQATLPPQVGLLQLADTLDHVDRAQINSLATIGSAARAKAARLSGLMADVGLTPERFIRPPAPIGGPFVPVPPSANSAFDRAAAELRETLDTASHLDAAVSHIPLAAPLTGSPEVTSPFGTRVDPFLGRLALHTGVDLREDSGMDVRTTAAGVVTAAGAAGGYGNMVEVDHGNGLRTRYAHLSDIDVTEGQSLPSGAIVGHVGATGRATGPHLHYEVRIDGEPVDPVRFLSAGSRFGANDPR